MEQLMVDDLPIDERRPHEHETEPRFGNDLRLSLYRCQRVIRRLRQRAANLGFALADRDTGEVLEGAVS
ncbi:MAG: hypothetical protein ACRD88_03865 [Terriglobia bacterium]